MPKQPKAPRKTNYVTGETEMSLLNEFLSRTHAHARAEREVIATALGIADVVRERASKIRADGRLSPLGRQTQIADAILGGPWAHYRQLRDRAAKIRADIETFRAKLVPAPPTDQLASDMNREIRARLLQMKRADLLRLARDDDRVATAALTAPPLLSGLNDQPATTGQPSDWDTVLRAYQARNFAREIAGLALREQAIATVDDALNATRDQICKEGGLGEAEIDRVSQDRAAA
jgi:hypothetical protein